MRNTTVVGRQIRWVAGVSARQIRWVAGVSVSVDSIEL